MKNANSFVQLPNIECLTLLKYVNNTITQINDN